MSFFGRSRLWRTLGVGILLALIVLVSIELRVSDLGRNYLEANEGGTFFLVLAPLDKYLVWGGMESNYSGTEAEWNGILAYYGLFKPAQQWLGMDEFSLRLIPMVCGVLGVIATFFLGRRIGGDGAGLLAALFLALNSEHIDLSRYYRFNSLALLMMVISTHLLLIALERRRRLWWYCYGVSTVLTLWSMMSCLFALTAHWLYLWMKLDTREERWRLEGSFVLIASLAVLPSFFFDPDAYKRILWYPHLSWKHFSSIWTETVSIWESFSAEIVFAYLATYACLLLGIKYAAKRWIQEGRDQAERERWLAILAGWKVWKSLAWLGVISGTLLLVVASLQGASVSDAKLVYSQDFQTNLQKCPGGSFWSFARAMIFNRGGFWGILILNLASLHALLGILPLRGLDYLDKCWPRLQVKRWALWGQEGRSSAELPLVLICLILPLMFMSLYSILVRTIMLARNVCFVIPAVTILIGCGFSKFNVGAKVLVLMGFFISWPYLTYGTIERLAPVPLSLRGWSRVAEVVQSEARDGDCLILKSVNGPSYRYYVYIASRYLHFPTLKVWPEIAWNGSLCPQVAFRSGKEFVRKIRGDQSLWIIHDEPWFDIMRLSDEDLEGFVVDERWFFDFGMQLTKLHRVR